MTINLEEDARWEEFCKGIWDTLNLYLPNDRVAFVLVLQGEKKARLEFTTNVDTDSAKRMLHQAIAHIDAAPSQDVAIRELDISRRPS